MHFLVTALFAIFAIAATSATVVGRESNAQRLARGLPPRSPKFGRTLPGFAQARDNPTPAFGALRPRSSAVSVTYMGKIEVRNSDNSVLGYVKNWASEPHVNGINFGVPGEDLHVSFTTFAHSHDSFDMLCTNPNFPKPFYVGISGTSATLAHGSRSIVDMANVPQTPAGVPAPGVNTESTVWQFNSDNNKLTVHYVNPDGSLPKTNIAYDIRENVLFFVGDLDAYNEMNDIPGSPVTFFLVPA